MAAITKAAFLALTPEERIDWWYSALNSEIRALRVEFLAGESMPGGYQSDAYQAAGEGARKRLAREIEASNLANARALVAAYEAAKVG